MTNLLDFFGGQWVRIGAAAALVALIAFGGWRLAAWHSAYEELPGVRADLDLERTCADPSECFLRQARERERQAALTHKVVNGYEIELAELRARPPVRRVLRVCPGAGDLSDAGAAAGTGGASAAAELVSGPVEFDPGPLFDLARRADELSAQMRAVQAWNAALAGPAEE